MSPARVFLADDHDVVRMGVRRLLERRSAIEVVGETESFDDLTRAVVLAEADVVLLDLSMPKGSAPDAIRRLRAAIPEVRILAFTGEEDSGLLRRVMDAGASGCVLKSSGLERLVEGLEAVAAGRSYVDPTITLESATTPAVALSRRELQVLRLVALGFKNREIAERLQVGVKSVETYRARVGEKLGVRTRAELVQHAMTMGVMDEPDES